MYKRQGDAFIADHIAYFGQPHQDSRAVLITQTALHIKLPEPVSYTHLDVYKRQVSPLRKASDALLLDNSHLSISPVSYTHLDVYKRQCQDCTSKQDIDRIRNMSVSFNQKCTFSVPL